MGKSFDNLVNKMYNDISDITKIEEVSETFKNEFLTLVDKVNFMLIEDKDNFYGYFLLKMGRDIKYDITSPTAVNFKHSKYIIYFNPIIFLQLNSEQMKSTIKHEIHHVLALHLLRAKVLKEKYSTLAINMAMDIVANQFIDYLPPYATTLEWVNLYYNLKLKPYMAMEYYVENIQHELDLLDENSESEEDDTKESEEDNTKEDEIEKKYDVSKTHDLWSESTEIDDKTLQEFTEKFASEANKGTVPMHISGLIEKLKHVKNEIPWNIVLRKQMGTLESERKKTITRRNRRQPNRLDLKGELRGHTAKVTIALDISGSISNEEFENAVKEIFNIVKNYNHEITILECDTEIRQMYRIKSVKDIRKRSTIGGGTKFEPVFKYLNNTDTNMLIYFTDGKGEERMRTYPRGYQTLWIISHRGEELSLKKPFGIVKKLKAIKVKVDNVDLLDIKNEGWSMNSQQPII